MNFIRRQPLRMVSAVLCVVALGAVMQSCGGSEATGVSFVRESADGPTKNPFMDGVNTAPAAQLVGDVDTSANQTVPPTSAAPADAPDERDSPPPSLPSGTTSVSGETAGLYGGTQAKAVCDATKMLAFLDDNPDKAAAWAKVLGIETDEIDQYVALLTPTVLRVDTAVTNHGYRDGVATTVPAVLQAGTAVFVDDHGVPVVKCSCGNPLTPPQSRQNASYTGASWKGFSAGSVTSVSASPDPMNDLVLVDPGPNTAFVRPVGTDGDADVPYLEPPAGSETGDPGDTASSTTSTTADDDASPSSSTSSSTPSSSTSSTSSIPASPVPAPGEDVVYNVSTNGVGGDCAGVPGAGFEMHVVGSTIDFGFDSRGPVNADGTFDFTVPGTVEGGLGTVSNHFSGRVDQGPPWALVATSEVTVTSPSGMTNVCISSYEGTRRDVPAEVTTTTTPPETTTTQPRITTTTLSQSALQPLYQTWYFNGRVDRAGSGCGDLGITVTPGPPQRIRVRWEGADDYSITFLGRPSRTVAVDAAGYFRGQTIEEGEGNPDQMRVLVAGGPVPAFGNNNPSPFQYNQILGEGDTVPGTFRVTICVVDLTADPVT